MERDEDRGDSRETPGGGDERLEHLVALYLGRLNDGERLDRARILAEQPDLGEEILRDLEAFLDLGAGGERDEPLRVIGDYTLRRQVGRGGMGIVYEAWENSMDRRVALKVLPRALAADTRTVMRFVREAQVAGKLRHPNVVSVYGMGLKEETPYYAMEFVEGETLAQVLANLRAAGGKEDQPERCLRMAKAFAGAADGLQHAHSRGVIHRDIKPSNLILDGEGRLRILDFGLARLEGQEALTVSGDLLGTPLYMSPEQARARKVAVDHRTDIYSLGATLYEVLTFEPPFRGKDNRDTLSRIIEREPAEPRKLDPRIPRDLETVVLKCLRKDPAGRYGTAEALAQDLQRFARGDPVEARPEAVWEVLARRARRHAWKLVLGGVTLVALLLGLWAGHRQSEGRARELVLLEPKILEAAIAVYGSELTLVAASGLPGSLLDPGAPCTSPITREDFETEPWRERLGEAVKVLESGARAWPRRPDIRYHLARARLLLGDRKGARSDAGTALSLAPDFVPARVLDSGPPVAPPAAVRGDPGDGRGWQAAWLEAHSLRRDLKWAESSEAYTRLLSLYGKGEPYAGALTEAYLGRGLTLLENKSFHRAALDFGLAGRLSGNFLEPMLLLGKAYCRAGLRDEAEGVFASLYSQAAPRLKNDAATWITAVYCGEGDAAKAIGWAGLRHPSLAFRVRGFFEYFRWNPEEAARACREALALRPDDAYARGRLGWSLLVHIEGRAGPGRDAELRELVEAAEWVVGRYPEGTHGRSLLACARIAQGKFDDAAREARHGLEIPPSDPVIESVAWMALAAAERCRGNLKEAEAAARRAVELHGRGWYNHQVHGEVLAAGGRWAESAEAFRRSIEVVPTRSAAYGLLAGSLIALGVHAEAVKACQEALDLLPANSQVHENLALALMKLGRLEESLGAAERGIERVPDRPRLHTVKGLVLERLGRVPDAVRSFCSALDLDPREEAARAALARLLEDPGWGRLPAELRRSAEEALRKDP